MSASLVHRVDLNLAGEMSGVGHPGLPDPAEPGGGSELGIYSPSTLNYSAMWYSVVLSWHFLSSVRSRTNATDNWFPGLFISPESSPPGAPMDRCMLGCLGP